jgi:hypothetical protein
LCTIPGAAETLQGLRRVPKPGGKFIFFEHVLSLMPPYNAGRNELSRCSNGLLKDVT